jgi:Arc/MetJ-type ribon-helix-helix transcriptional regulator
MGADVIVTVRMPASLITAMRERIAADHFSDISEQVRSVVRKGCLRFSNPVTHEIKELKEQLKTELLQESDDARTRALLESLKTLLSEHGGGQR